MTFAETMDSLGDLGEVVGAIAMDIAIALMQPMSVKPCSIGN